ncbi:Capsular polysaccharide biosynthesis glycosyltransferase [Nymphaea thermarum]|nr:Capsular polysaccharide biosynthesis glycosyltransferase [Nymphaea thermarum]
MGSKALQPSAPTIRKLHSSTSAAAATTTATSSSSSICFLSTIILPASLLFAFLLLLHTNTTTTIYSSSSSLSSIASSRTATSPPGNRNWTGDLRFANFAWNKLCFGPVKERLRLAAFSKKWPVGAVPGGMERHAHGLYTALALAGHTVHVFTAPSDRAPQRLDRISDGNLHVHFASNGGGTFDDRAAWKLFADENKSLPFDLLHTESVALKPSLAREVPNLAATWHGIAYEILHSDLFQDLIRGPGESRSNDADARILRAFPKLLEEIRFFTSYKHHIAISDSVGDILTNIYQLPRENVHIILNGVDHENFYHDPKMGARFRQEFGVPANARLVMGASGRLVRDKGHPLLFRAFSAIRERHPDVYLLVAGSGPWEKRYRELKPNVKLLGPLKPSRLAEFYNALDVFVDPTLRPQGLDLTLMEAMHCGKPLLATNFPSITGSVVLNEGFGYTFAPNVKSLTEAMEAAIWDGPAELAGKGMTCKEHALSMFTARKMASAYERFFLCLKDVKYCRYPLETDC